MSRLIDADKLKAVIDKNMLGTIKEVFNEYIDVQPTVNEWIPVERELPKDTDDVWAMCKAEYLNEDTNGCHLERRDNVRT